MTYSVLQEADSKDFKAQLKTKDEEAQQAKKDFETQLAAKDIDTQRAEDLARKTYEAKLKKLHIQLTAMETEKEAVQLELASVKSQLAADNEAFPKRFEVNNEHRR